TAVSSRSTASARSASLFRNCAMNAVRAGCIRSSAAENAASIAALRRASRGSLTQRLLQPGAGALPVALHRAQRHVERGGRFRLGHAAEQPALGDTLQPLVELPQHGECVVDRDQCHGVAIESGDVMHECYRTMAAPALERGARPDVVDNGAPHGTGGNREKMGATLPWHVLHVDNAQPCLVRESRRVQRITVIASKLRTCGIMQFAVQVLIEEVERRPVPCARTEQQVRGHSSRTAGHGGPPRECSGYGERAGQAPNTASRRARVNNSGGKSLPCRANAFWLNGSITARTTHRERYDGRAAAGGSPRQPLPSITVKKLRFPQFTQFPQFFPAVRSSPARPRTRPPPRLRPRPASPDRSVLLHRWTCTDQVPVSCRGIHQPDCRPEFVDSCPWCRIRRALAAVRV